MEERTVPPWRLSPLGGGGEGGSGRALAHARAHHLELERVRPEHHLDPGRGRRVLLQGGEEMLDDAVARELKARRQQAGVAGDLEANIELVGLAEQPVELGQHRLGARGRLLS